MKRKVPQGKQTVPTGKQRGLTDWIYHRKADCEVRFCLSTGHIVAWRGKNAPKGFA